MLTPEEEKELASLNMIDKYKREREEEERKVYMYRYEANGLKNCKDNANLMGQK